MEQEHLSGHQPPEEGGPTDAVSQAKAPWQEPKLTFVEPTLTPHGELKAVTGGFFGTFIP